jgi:hypothetical protein
MPVDPYGQPFPPPVVTRTRRGRTIAIAVISAVAGLLVLAAVGVAVVVLLNKQPTGEQAVRAYFEKLALGDAEAALTYVLPPRTGSFEDDPLLTATVLADPDARPTGLQVAGRSQTTLPDGDIRERVTVSYTVGETEFRQTILTRQQEKGEQFQLENPFFLLSVTGYDSRGFSINGVPIGSDVRGRLVAVAFPGLYAGAVEENELFAEEIVDATGRDSGELPAELRITFEPTLAAGAEEAVQAAVNAHIDGCLQDHGLVPVTLNPDGQPTTCPFGLTADEVISVNWSIGRYPDVAIELSGPDLVLISSVADGLVRYDLPDGWIDDEFAFDFTGTAFVEDGTVKVQTNYT